jgi:hypothetical protein
MMAMMLIRSGNISILAQAAIIASPITIANPNILADADELVDYIEGG